VPAGGGAGGPITAGCGRGAFVVLVDGGGVGLLGLPPAGRLVGVGLGGGVVVVVVVVGGGVGLSVGQLAQW